MLKLFFALIFFALPGRASAEEIIAVLSSDSDYYQQAFSGFQEAFGGNVPVFSLQKTGNVTVGGDTHVIVTFGGKATKYSYPQQADIIYCLSAGVQLSQERQGASTEIFLIPSAEKTLSLIKRIQPEINHLDIF